MRTPNQMYKQNETGIKRYGNKNISKNVFADVLLSILNPKNL